MLARIKPGTHLMGRNRKTLARERRPVASLNNSKLAMPMRVITSAKTRKEILV